MSLLPSVDAKQDEWQCVWDLASHSKDPLSSRLHNLWESGASRLSLWRSTSTGLRIAVGSVPHPVIWGTFVLPTESFSDDGCPHTLEHLVFMGSKHYPFKGVLDEIAKRNFSNGTNASTHTHLTEYNYDCIGSNAFLNILPVYVDHILFPTMKESAFCTEVHHITEEGKDAGVVYCEMQARENTQHEICYRALMHALYPGHNGAKSQTGGRLKEIRDLNSDTVRQYHHDFYYPENLCLMIFGDIEVDDVMKSLESTLETIKRDKGVFKVDPPKPWSTSIDNFEIELKEVVKFPSEDESLGVVYVGCRGPAFLDIVEHHAMQYVTGYLTDTTLAPLQKELIEIESPYCSDVSSGANSIGDCSYYLVFFEVPKEKIDKITDHAFNIIEKICRGEIAFDLGRIRRMLKRARKMTLSYLETGAESIFSQALNDSLVFGDISNVNWIVEFITPLEKFEFFLQQDESYWLSLMEKYFLKRPKATILGYADAGLVAELANTEEKRVENQKQVLGEQKLTELGQHLQTSKAENEIPVPAELLNKFKTPELRFNRFQISSMFSHKPPVLENKENLLDSKDAELLELCPMWMMINHLKTAFVNLHIYMDSSNLTEDLLPYFGLYKSMLFDSPLLLDGKLIPLDDVVIAREEDAVYSWAFSGCGGFFPDAFGVGFKFLTEDYEKMFEWACKIIWNVEFDVERIKIHLRRCIASWTDAKRDGSYVAGGVLSLVDYDKTKHNNISSFFRALEFMQSLLTQLESGDNVAGVLEMLNRIKKIVTQPERMRMVLNLNCKRTQSQMGLLPEVYKFVNYGRKYLGLPSDSPKPAPPPKFQHGLIHLDKLDPSHAYIVTVAGVDGATLYSGARGTPHLSDPDFPAYDLLVQYLSCSEGPIWKRVRGNGLAYGCGLGGSVDSGKLTLSIQCSTNVVDAYVEMIQVLTEFDNSTVEMDPDQVEAVKSSLISSYVKAVSTPRDVIDDVISAEFCGAPRDWTYSTMEKVQKTTIEEMKQALRKHLMPITRSDCTNLIITCAPTEAQNISERFQEKVGRTLQVFTIDEFIDHSKAIGRWN